MTVERSEADRGATADQLVTSVLGRTRLSLRFILGRLELMTSEIMALSVGQVLTLDEPVSSRVDLVVDGVSIGRGELVEIAGGRGVRLLNVDDAER